ncbi:hypothetical protein [Urechidicola croceus]|uniref:Uncharacterized protein n=1 Tax=Urechidicola croceus TaxID=1850246 RepID=A0A1D8PAL3_9FLAO|nr:hypothetical protein [Urechidicola croceus]AOW21571.1 hypothetical protein LPB138_13180 [Urechidicola croceus]
MKLISFRPIAFLLDISAGNFYTNNVIESFTVISVNNEYLSLLGVSKFTLNNQQKSVGLFLTKEKFTYYLNKISQYILVGKDKSVVAFVK